MWESSQISGITKLLVTTGVGGGCQLVLAWSGRFSALPLLHKLQKVLSPRAVWQQNKLAFYFPLMLTLKWAEQRESGEALSSTRAGRPLHCHEEQCPRRRIPGRTLSHHILFCSHEVKITQEERERGRDKGGQHVNTSSRLDEIFTISSEISFSWVHNTQIWILCIFHLILKVLPSAREQLFPHTGLPNFSSFLPESLNIQRFNEIGSKAITGLLHLIVVQGVHLYPANPDATIQITNGHVQQRPLFFSHADWVKSSGRAMAALMGLLS